MENLIPPDHILQCTSSLTPDISRGDGFCTSRTKGTRGAEPTVNGNLPFNEEKFIVAEVFDTTDNGSKSIS